MSDYDLIIVGGGMVGATLACALGNTELRIAVMDTQAAPRDWPPAEYDIRVSAITRATQHVFEAVGAWEGMVTRRVAPYREMHVWDGTGSGSIHFDSAELGEPDLGHIVENRVIIAALLDRLEQLENVDYLCPAEVRALDRRGDEVRLTLADGRLLSGKLLVGADGSRSWVRDQAGIATTGWSYGQSAVVATIRTEHHHRDTAWQRFLPEGPLAFLPLPEGLSSIVWSTTPERAAMLVKLDEPEFLAQLHHAFGDSLGRMEQTGPRGAFPLALQHAHRYVDDRIALIGNAAHTIHPLAGQGLNLGVSDAAALAEVVLSTAGGDVGRYSLLRRYERWRKGENLTMMAAMDGFKRLFGSEQPALRWLRNTGLQLTNSAGPIKTAIMRRALGVNGDLPRLARGSAYRVSG